MTDLPDDMLVDMQLKGYRPKHFLFENGRGGNQLTAQSIQLVIQQRLL